MILQQLREATGPVHKQLESNMPLLDENFELDNYVDFLKRMLAFYKPLELDLVNACRDFFTGSDDLPLEFDYVPRQRHPRLRRDLTGLLPSFHRQFYCLQDHLPLLDSPAKVLGCLYVIEGATLGGVAISRVLQKRFGLTPNSGLSFFEGLGEERTKNQWRVFCAFLEQAAKLVNNDKEIVQSAESTFFCFGSWIAPRMYRYGTL